MNATVVREPECRFDAEAHVYTIDGYRVPSITQLLEMSGHVDTTFFTDESCDRGDWVHRVSAAYDLGAIDNPAQVEVVAGAAKKRWVGYFQAHVAAMQALKPHLSWLAIEQARFSVKHHFAGRPDREAKLYRAISLVEIKSAVKQPSHSVQLALQAILVAPTYRLPPELIKRYILYLQENGRYELYECPSKRDYAEAYGILRDYAKAA